MKSNFFWSAVIMTGILLSCQVPTQDPPGQTTDIPATPEPPAPQLDITGPQITAPSLSAVSLPEDKPLTVRAQVTDSESGVQGVTLYNADKILGTLTLTAQQTYTLTLDKLAPGTYDSLKIQAKDTAGNITWTTLPQFKSLSTNSLLSKIQVKNTSSGATYSLSPAFSPTVYRYTTTVSGTSITVTPTKADPNATGKSTQTQTGSRQITCSIIITAEAGTGYTHTYTVIVNY